VSQYANHPLELPHKSSGCSRAWMRPWPSTFELWRVDSSPRKETNCRNRKRNSTAGVIGTRDMRAARGERNEPSYAAQPQHVMRNDLELMSYSIDERAREASYRVDVMYRCNEINWCLQPSRRMQMRWAASVVPGR